MKKVTILILALILTACSLTATPDFEKNLAKWRDANITHYRYSISIGCFCPFADEMPVTIEIKDAEIVSMTSANGAVFAPSNDSYSALKQYAGMDVLFTQLKAAIDTADKVEVTYDPTNGFPTSIAIDQIEQAMDDELYISVEGFEILK